MTGDVRFIRRRRQTRNCMFFVCEVAMGILKAINVSYPENALLTEAGIFCALCLVEVIRIFLGRRGNLASKKIPVFFSVILTIPSAVGVCYFLIYQTYILRLEYIWCAVMLIFHALELAFAILFIFTVCKHQQFE
ncbi:transmembrane protein 216-like isoform X2 [Ostrinia furnacalis]|uniref:transmembrane protein 216-like isoform X2 n=1 Tax=Ostrinia furnacalis TaxID=93504 RepID=UPI001039E655|nr:transmembrane protein 216-like isoform X2 [Ostrinia furnacalis]